MHLKTVVTFTALVLFGTCISAAPLWYQRGGDNEGNVDADDTGIYKHDAVDSRAAIVGIVIPLPDNPPHPQPDS
jgi:hypothetical protein